MMIFKCEHQPDCSKPDRYGCHVDYIEIYSSEGLVEVFPNDDEPAQFQCLNCDAVATLEVSETTRQNRQARVEESKQVKLL
jgi:hypothetical protein